MTFSIEGAEGVSADLGKIPTALYKVSTGVLEKGALDLKDQLNQNLADSKHFRAAAGSVTYDRKASFGSVAFEIGPDKERRAGALGNIAFFGGSGWGGSHSGGTVDLDGAVKSIGERTQGLLGLAVKGLL